MKDIVLGERKLPIKPLDISMSDCGVTIRIIGFSGDSVRTCIYYTVDDNPLDYQVSEAYIVDENERAYCLVSVERKGEGIYSSWMEFGPIPPETLQLQLHIIRLRQAPTCKGFKLKGRSFIDPWDRDFSLSNELIDKMDNWLGGISDVDELATSDWDLKGTWSYIIPTGKWENEETDIITPLCFTLDLGKEIITLHEFRNSNSGALLLFEARDESLQKLGDDYKKLLGEKLALVGRINDFQQELDSLGINMGYIPVGLNLKLRNKDTGQMHNPAYMDSRGIIQNRLYYFFDECICFGNIEVVISEIFNIKLDPPADFVINMSDFSSDEVMKINYDLGDITVKGEIVFQELSFLEENLKISYISNTGAGIDDLSLVDVSLMIKRDEGVWEEFPCLGGTIDLAVDRERFKKVITFPAVHRIKKSTPESLRFLVKSINIKPSQPVVFGFETTAKPCICDKKEE